LKIPFRCGCGESVERVWKSNQEPEWVGDMYTGKYVETETGWGPRLNIDKAVRLYRCRLCYQAYLIDADAEIWDGED